MKIQFIFPVQTHKTLSSAESFSIEFEWNSRHQTRVGVDIKNWNHIHSTRFCWLLGLRRRPSSRVLAFTKSSLADALNSNLTLGSREFRFINCANVYATQRSTKMFADSSILAKLRFLFRKANVFTQKCFHKLNHHGSDENETFSIQMNADKWNEWAIASNWARSRTTHQSLVSAFIANERRERGALCNKKNCCVDRCLISATQQSRQRHFRSNLKRKKLTNSESLAGTSSCSFIIARIAFETTINNSEVDD